MDTSYVAVGTAMYMITDNRCPPKNSPAGARRWRRGGLSHDPHRIDAARWYTDDFIAARPLVYF